MPPHRHGGFRAEERFLEFQGQVFAQIGAALHPAAAAATTASKYVVHAKKFAEDVAQILETCAVKSPALPAAQASMAVAVIRGALVPISEHRIGLAHLFEFFLGVRIIGVAVGMVLERQFAIGALQLNFGDRAGHTQYFVVIAFCVRRQNRPFPLKNFRKKLVVTVLLKDCSPPSPSPAVPGGPLTCIL